MRGNGLRAVLSLHVGLFMVLPFGAARLLVPLNLALLGLDLRAGMFSFAWVVARQICVCIVTIRRLMPLRK